MGGAGTKRSYAADKHCVAVRAVSNLVRTCNSASPFRRAMGVLLRPAQRALAPSRQGRLKPFAILRIQTMALQNYVQDNFCNIVGGAIIRLIGAVLLEANDEWQLQYRYMQTEAMAELTPPLMTTIATEISTQAA